MRVARVPAQAKVNLTLLVGGKDTSGYHDVFTHLARIELADEVTVRVGGRGRSLDCAGPRMPAGGLGPVEKNLAWRAAVAYADATGFGHNVQIEIGKHIPVGGGLGGGSADAGAVLRALDRLSPRPLRSRLHEIARTLGADVPFLAGEAAHGLALGRGDEWGPLPPPVPGARPLLLAIPPYGIATADAYRWLDEAGGGSLPPDLRSPPEGMNYGFNGIHDWKDAAEQSVNDFEAALEPRFPELRRLREGLLAGGAILARLSGSGSTVFGVFQEGRTPTLELGDDTTIIATRIATDVVPVVVQE